MRVLFLCKSLPFVAKDGAAIRNFAILKHLSKSHEVKVLSFARSANQVRFTESHLPDGVKSSAVLEERNFARKLRDVLLSLVNAVPYTVQAHNSAAFRRELLTIVDEFQPEVCLIQEVYLSSYLQSLSRTIPCLIDLHNRESVILTRLANHSKKVLQRNVLRFQAFLMDKHEASLSRYAHAAIALSRVEQDWFRSFQARVLYIPNGVERRDRPPSARSRRSSRVFFVGSLDYPPNLDGVKFFLGGPWDKIRSRIPNVEFHIVGAGATRIAAHTTSGGVWFHGSLDSIDPFLRESSLLIVPLRAGAGTRLKILEAFQWGLPVVSTSVGAEGLEVCSGTQLLIADSEEAIVEAVVALLENEDKREQVAESAYQWSQENLLWDQVLAPLDSMLQELSRNKQS